jgi:hypothetical protein
MGNNGDWFSSFNPEIEKPEVNDTPISNSFGDVFKPSTFNPEQYNNVNPKGFIPYSNDLDYQSALEETRARNQSVGNLIGKSGVQMATSFAGMLFSAAGALGHPLAMFSKEREDNVLDEIGAAITQSGQDIAPIYQTKEAQSGFNPSDATEFWSGAPSVVASMAMMLPGLGLVKGLGLMGNTLAKAENVGKILNATGRGLEVATGTPFGAALIAGTNGRHIDSYLSSAQTYQELEQQGQELGMTPEESKKYAGDGARRGYQLGMMNAAFDVAELGILLKGTSYLSRNLKNLTKVERESAGVLSKETNLIDKAAADAISATTTKPTLKSAIGDYLKVGALEGVDEGTMDIAQNAGKYYVEHKYGINPEEKSYGQIISESIAKDETKQDIFWGAIGGLFMEGSSHIVNKTLFDKHFDNETNRIKDSIERNRELRVKIKNIQDLQSQGNNYEAEQVHQSIINDIAASGIQHGTFDLDLKTIENLSKIGFSDLTIEQKEELNKQDFNEQSPKIAQEIHSRLVKAKDIFEKHVKKDYTTGVKVDDKDISKESLKNLLSMVAGSKESDIDSRNDIIKKAKVEENQLKETVVQTTNGTKNSTVKDHIEALSTLEAANINVTNLTEQYDNHKKAIDTHTRTLFQLKNQAENATKSLGRNVSTETISPNLENFLNFSINTNTEAMKIISKQLDEFKAIQKEAQSKVDTNQKYHDNAVENLKNINTENYTAKPTIGGYSQNTIDEIAATLKNPEYLPNATRLAVVQKNIQELERQQRIAKQTFDKFQKDPLERQKLANDTIKFQKEQVQKKKDDLKSEFDIIPKDGNTVMAIDSNIKNIQQFIDKIAKKESPTVANEIITEANNTISQLNKRKETAIKTEKENKLIKDAQSKAASNTVNATIDKIEKNAPIENKDIDSVSLDDTSTPEEVKSSPIRKPFITIDDTATIDKQQHETDSKEDKLNLKFYSPVSLKKNHNKSTNKIEDAIHEVLTIFDNLLNDTFHISKDGAKIRSGKTKEQVNNSIITLNNLKDKYLKLVKLGTGQIDLEIQSKLTGNPYVQTDVTDTEHNTSIEVGAKTILRNLDRVNNLIENINKTKTEQDDVAEISLDFKDTLNSLQVVTDIIKRNIQDPIQQDLRRNEILEAIFKVYNNQDKAQRDTNLKTASDLLNNLFKEFDIKSDIKYSKDLNIPLEIDINDMPLKIRMFQGIENFNSAYRYYHKNILQGNQAIKEVTFMRLMTGIYRENPDLVDVMYESLNTFLLNVATDLDHTPYNIGDQPLSKILDRNPAIPPSKIHSDNYLNILKSELKRINDRIFTYNAINGVYVQNPVRPVLDGITQLRPFDQPFIDYVNTINNLTLDSEITIRNGSENSIEIVSNGGVIGTLSTPSFTYGGVQYSQLDANKEYQFRNPFEYITSDQIALIEEMQDVLHNIWFSNSKKGVQFTKDDILNLSNGTYGAINENIKDQRDKQKELYKTYLYFLVGQTSNTALTPESFRQLVSPLFIGDSYDNTLRLTRDEIKQRLDNHVERFQNDFNRMMEIRKNPTNFKFSVERISTPSVLHDENNDHFLNEVIKPVDGKIKILGKQLGKESIDLYDLTTGDRAADNEQIKDRNDKDTKSDTLFLALESNSGNRIVHKLYVSNLINDKFDTRNNKEYNDYSKRSVDFIIDEFVKLLNRDNTSINSIEYNNLITNLKKLIVVDNGYLTTFDKITDNLTFNFTLPFDNETKEIRTKKLKINKTKNGKFTIHIGDSNINEKAERATLVKDEGIQVYNPNGNSDFTEQELRTQLLEYVPNILRNFHYNNTQLDIASLNDTGDSSYDNTFFDPLDRYKPIEQRKRYDGSKFGHPYLDFAISTGAVKTNIGAIKQDNNILSNFNLGSKSEYGLSVHIKYEKITEEKPAIEQVQTTEDLKNSTIIPSFEPYTFLLEDLDPLKISFKGEDENDIKDKNGIKIETHFASIQNGNLSIYENTIKNANLSIENEIAHELIHANLDQRIFKLTDNQKVELSDKTEYIYKVLDTIVNDKINDKWVHEPLTQRDKDLINGLLDKLDFNNVDKIHLNNIQEMFTYVFTRKELAIALNKIKYVEGVTKKGEINAPKTIWDKLLDLIHFILGTTNPSIINNINEILNFSLTRSQSNISNQSVQSSEPIKSERVQIDNLNKDGIDFVFNQNSELINIGSKEEYLNYINSIFPDSKIKDIVYHGSINKSIENFDKELIGTKNKQSTGTELGIFFTSQQDIAKGFSIEEVDPYGELYGEEDYNKYGKIYPVILNINNLYSEEILDKYNYVIPNKVNKVNNLLKIYDGIYFHTINYQDKLVDEYIIKESNQIHILGNNQDIKGFKEFVKNNNKPVSSSINEFSKRSKHSLLLNSKNDYKIVNSQEFNNFANKNNEVNNFLQDFRNINGNIYTFRTSYETIANTVLSNANKLNLNPSLTKVNDNFIVKLSYTTSLYQSLDKEQSLKDQLEYYKKCLI